MQTIVKTLTQTFKQKDFNDLKKQLPSSILQVIKTLENDGFFIDDIIDETFLKIEDCNTTYTQNVLKGFESFTIDIITRQGGLDAQDLALKQLKMYTNFFNLENISYQLVDFKPGDVGIHQATIHVTNSFLIPAFWPEHGSHRFERNSPFNAKNKVQTSNVEVNITPMQAKKEIHINLNDVELIPIKASGPGGQYVNKTKTGIILRYKPKNIIIRSTQFRSQQANKQFALNLLMSKLESLNNHNTQTNLPPLSKTNIIRTYDLTSNIVRGKLIKQKFNNAEKILNGHIHKLLLYNILYVVRRTCDKTI